MNTVAFEGLDPNSRTPYSEQASLEINRELMKGLAAGAGKAVSPLDWLRGWTHPAVGY